ncbi:tetratricopeptide repeat protein [candidate division KSB1 bacterium]|nr:tetratricopeptide repeat protein [candidate division KSB1 bacterium]
MRTNSKHLLFWKTFTVISLMLITAGLIYLTGCAPTAQQTEISPERQKAIQDSLQKAYIYELNKAWSTGYEYYKPKIYNRALKPFWRVIKLDTIDRFKDVFGYLSTSYFELGKPDSAQLVLEMGIEKYPDNVGLRRNLAYILEKKELIGEAITQYEKVVELDGNDASDWKRLANLYLRNDQIDDAIIAYQKIIEIDPSDQDAQQTLGQLLKGTGDSDAAIQALEKALELDPDNTQLMFDIGKSYFDQGDYTKSIEKLNQYLQKNPEDVFAKEMLGEAYFNKGNYRKALNTFKEVVEARPQNKKVYVDIANSYKELGNYPTARNYVYRAMKIDNRYGRSYLVLGQIYEAAVDDCMRKTNKKSPKFDDKLVYKEAVRQYELATRDLQFANEAERQKSYLKDFLPKKEDEFFNKDRRTPNGKYRIQEDCYKWIADAL